MPLQSLTDLSGIKQFMFGRAANVLPEAPEKCRCVVNRMIVS